MWSIQWLGRSLLFACGFHCVLCIHMLVYVNVLLLLCEANDVNILLDHGRYGKTNPSHTRTSTVCYIWYLLPLYTAYLNTF